MLLITLSALIMISAVHPTSQSLAYDSSASFPEHKKLRNVLDQINLTIEIDLIGYSEEMIDTDYLETMLDQSFYLSAPTGGSVTLKLNLEFNFLDPTVAELMETYIQSAGTQGSGVAYSLNTTLLTDDLATGQRRNIFIPEDGITLNVEDLKFSKKQIAAIQEALLPQRNGGSANIKINDDGLVFCNYYKEYLAPEMFKKTPSDKYPPMSIEGTKLRQRLMTLDKQMNKEISEAFLKGTKINKEELITNLNIINKILRPPKSPILL